MLSFASELPAARQRACVQESELPERQQEEGLEYFCGACGTPVEDKGSASAILVPYCNVCAVLVER